MRGGIYVFTYKQKGIKLSKKQQVKDPHKCKIKSSDTQIFVLKPIKITLSDWFCTWIDTFCQTLSTMTVQDYIAKANRYILPNLGQIPVDELTQLQVQSFCNSLTNGYEGQKPLSPKTVKNIHGILHSCLKQAQRSGVIKQNPSDLIKLPKISKPDISPLMDTQVADFLKAIRGHQYEVLYILALFSGLRESELLGLSWDDINFENGAILVQNQLQKDRHGRYFFVDHTKNGKNRIAVIPPSIIKILKKHRAKQAEWQLAKGANWENTRNLVFTTKSGNHLRHNSIYKHFKRVVASIGVPNVRFHDLRHSCAILAVQSGCDVKSIQEQLGHYSSSFTLDVYVAMSETMREDTKGRMEKTYQHLIKQMKATKGHTLK